MNTLVVYAHEVSRDGLIIVNGERADVLIKAQSLRGGERIRVAVLDTFRAFACVTLVDKHRVELTLAEKVEPLPRLPVTLLVAVPRPQTVKKVISLAAQAGIEALYFVRSYHTVPSYLQSHSLFAENIQIEMHKGLEQVWDAVAPEIHIVEKMGDVFSTLLPALLSKHPDAHLFLAEPRNDDTRAMDFVLQRSAKKHVVLGIGPEKGWSNSELEGFRTQGVSLVHLDQREYRVETAIAFFIGQLQAYFARADYKED